MGWDWLLNAMTDSNRYATTHEPVGTNGSANFLENQRNPPPPHAGTNARIQ
jgi:hypothetical protein